MHKIFLTEPEVSFIKGADAIVDALGGFPSMENGKLVEISVRDAGLSYTRYNVTLVFDIEGWGRTSSLRMDIPRPESTLIQMEFLNVRDVFISSPYIDCCGEFKFGNTYDRKEMYRDFLPSHPIVVERPYFTFYMNSGHEFVLEFDDSDCLVFASFLEDRQAMDIKQKFLNGWQKRIKHALPEVADDVLKLGLSEAYKARYGEEPTQELLDECLKAQTE